MFPGEWHEPDRQDLPGDELPAGLFLDQYQLLGEKAAADGNHHAATGFELRHQRWRHVAGGRRDHDGVERGVFLPAIVAVADARRYILIAQT